MSRVKPIDVPREKLHPGTVASVADLAKAVGVSRRTAHDWVNRDDFPREENGTFNVAAVERWRSSRKGAPPLDVSDEQSRLKDRLTLAEVRKAEADAQTKEVKLKLLAGELVERDAVSAEIERMFHIVRTRIEAIPEELASSLPPDLRSDYTADVRQKVYLILKELENTSEA